VRLVPQNEPLSRSTMTSVEEAQMVSRPFCFAFLSVSMASIPSIDPSRRSKGTSSANTREGYIPYLIYPIYAPP